MALVPIPEKTCMVCGRRMSWRKKWERSWDEVRYCSRKCSERRLMVTDYRLEAAIQHLLSEQPAGGTICPSDAARRVDPICWRRLMEPTRMAARRLVAAGKIELLQGSRVVDPSTAKGSFRLRLASRS